ncbi:MAG TPA: PA domain-containing protein, partial [Acidimicrobiales bacterium]
MMWHRRTGRAAIAVLAIAGIVATFGAPAGAHPDPGDGQVHDGGLDGHHEDPSATLAERDAATADVISDGPFSRVTKNLDPIGRGERNVEDATTDVWAHDGYAYTGTFNSPCGGEPDGGVWVWNVEDPSKPRFETLIPSPTGSRSNDVKVAAMGSGDILVHSNERCAAGGPGGFEIYDVDDPANPVHLAHVRIDELNEITPFFFAPGSLEDVGVHNLFLFRQGERDLVAAQSEGIFDGFRIYDITDPTAPELVSGWGAEEVFDPGVGDLTLADDPTGDRTLDAVLWMLGLAPRTGFGASPNRLLHDFTITSDGTQAYLAHWDAGLILLDISDPADPQYVSTALDPVNGSLDGEVNSHSVWPSEDGTTVVEGEEDFSVFESEVPPGNLTLQNLNSIPGVTISTSAGDAFEGSPTGNSGTVTATSVAVTGGPLAGETFPAVEFVGNNVPLGSGSVSGDFVWVGLACNGDAFENPVDAGDIAVVRRGACFFSEKEANVAAAGAAAIVVANNQQDSVWSGLRI